MEDKVLCLISSYVDENYSINFWYAKRVVVVVVVLKHFKSKQRYVEIDCEVEKKKIDDSRIVDKIWEFFFRKILNSSIMAQVNEYGAK